MVNSGIFVACMPVLWNLDDAVAGTVIMRCGIIVLKLVVYYCLFFCRDRLKSIWQGLNKWQTANKGRKRLPGRRGDGEVE